MYFWPLTRTKTGEKIFFSKVLTVVANNVYSRYVSRGELKLAQRNLSLTQVNAIIDELDVNGDGKLTFDEVKQVALKVKDQAKVSKSKKSNR